MPCLSEQKFAGLLEFRCLRSEKSVYERRKTGVVLLFTQYTWSRVLSNL